MTENVLACRNALGTSLRDIVKLVRNGLTAAFITEEGRAMLLNRLDTYVSAQGEATSAEGEWNLTS